MRELVLGVIRFLSPFIFAVGVFTLIGSISNLDTKGILAGGVAASIIFFEDKDIEGFLWIVAIFIAPALGGIVGLSVAEGIMPESTLFHAACFLSGFVCAIWLLTIVYNKYKNS